MSIKKKVNGVVSDYIIHASDVQLLDVNNNFTSTTVEGALKENTDKIGVLNGLETNYKDDLVGAINENTESLYNMTKYNTNVKKLCTKTIEKMLWSNSTNIVAFGDSLTWGRLTTGAIQALTPYPVSLQDYLRKIYNNSNINVINKGVSGNTVSALWSRIDTDVISQNPDCCIVMIGSNDTRLNVTTSSFKTTLTNIAKKLIDNDIEVVFMSSVPEFDTNQNYNKKIILYMKIMQEIAEQHNIAFIDIYNIFQSRYSNQTEIRSIIQSDDVHLIEGKYQIISDEILRKSLGYNTIDLSIIKNNEEFSVPVVKSPYVISDSSFIHTNSTYRTGEAYALKSDDSIGTKIIFPFTIVENNITIKLRGATAPTGGKYNIYDNGILIGAFDFSNIGNPKLDKDYLLIENLSVGFHQIEILSSNYIIAGELYVSEFVFLKKYKRYYQNINYKLQSGGTLGAIERFNNVMTGKVRYINTLNNNFVGVGLYDTEILTLKNNKKLIIELDIVPEASTGITWFGEQTRNDVLPTYNIGYLLYFYSTSDVRLLKSDGFTGLVSITSTTTASVNIDVTNKVRIEHNYNGSITVYLNGTQLFSVIDTTYNNGYMGLYLQNPAKIDISNVMYAYV